MRTAQFQGFQDPKDAILRVKVAAICGSDMHFYRVHLKSPPGFIVGHELEGVVHEVGNEDKILRVGEEVVVPFTTACGECFYCEKKLSSRREKGFLFSQSLKLTSNVLV